MGAAILALRISRRAAKQAGQGSRPDAVRRHAFVNEPNTIGMMRLTSLRERDLGKLGPWRVGPRARRGITCASDREEILMRVVGPDAERQRCVVGGGRVHIARNCHAAIVRHETRSFSAGRLVRRHRGREGPTSAGKKHGKKQPWWRARFRSTTGQYLISSVRSFRGRAHGPLSRRHVRGPRLVHQVPEDCIFLRRARRRRCRLRTPTPSPWLAWRVRAATALVGIDSFPGVPSPLGPPQAPRPRREGGRKKLRRAKNTGRAGATQCG